MKMKSISEMHVCNAAAMRESLVEAVGNTCAGCARDCDDCMNPKAGWMKKAKHALSAPPRNCDRFGSESEMQVAFIDWYNEAYDLKGSKYEIDTSDLKHDVDGILHEYIKWLFATEQKGDSDGRK